jgi:hypothetical protein
MTREQKIAKKKLNAYKRAEKHNKKYRDLVSNADGYPLSHVKNGSWYDPSSPTGYSQICCYYRTCQSPCNGDC